MVVLRGYLHRFTAKQAGGSRQGASCFPSQGRNRVFLQHNATVPNLRSCHQTSTSPSHTGLIVRYIMLISIRSRSHVQLREPYR